MKARSVVIIAIWPSWVSAIGAERRMVSVSSAVRWFSGAASTGARSILSREVMEQQMAVAQVEIVAMEVREEVTYPRTRSGTRVILAPSAFKRSSMRS